MESYSFGDAGDSYKIAEIDLLYLHAVERAEVLTYITGYLTSIWLGWQMLE